MKGINVLHKGDRIFITLRRRTHFENAYEDWLMITNMKLFLNEKHPQNAFFLFLIEEGLKSLHQKIKNSKFSNY